MSDTVASVAAAKYVMLTTYKKDGTAVASPLWAAPDGDDMLLWTVVDSWKVKRLRRNNNVLVQACDARGGKTHGPQVAGVAEVIDRQPAADAIVRKYGLIGRLTIWGSSIRRGASGTVGIRVRDVL
ncbi:PPOX class F420-dependent oxidoreductase [Gordonia neofelifaecis]|uniref:PPOX class putative F420-dependent enzyme n=1 Tax=Gordonia neofelifaecis NRRL B-59395 TaxID=644548 RepID=F1YLT3_9ACTN|nr:PPOX class F420-dependent oxidoreductase [Gordonia neofelifaecis]EGD54477.1 PPOX class putative F420-dependent enzyme [Gordonia neofelifaecis NRRL B-59395]